MEATFYARRGNKLLRINESAIDRYLGQGYTITDASGKVVGKGTPRDTNQLTAEFKKQRDENEKLVAEVAKLKAELEQAKKELMQAQTELDKVKSTPVSTEPKPTRKRKQNVEQATEEE